MILARFNSTSGPVIGIGISDEDLERLVQGRPMSFALSDAQQEGPHATDRVLVAYARPEQMEQFRNGYFPGITDARIVLFVNFVTAQQLRAGQALDIATPGAPIERFVVFRGTSRERAEQALRSVGLPVRVRAPEPTTPEPTTPEPISPLASPSWAEAWGEADKVPTN